MPPGAVQRPGKTQVLPAPMTAVHCAVVLHVISQQRGWFAQMVAMHASPHIVCMLVAAPGASTQAS
jgi:hypothetical protein